jgi:hypothetical protein
MAGCGTLLRVMKGKREPPNLVSMHGHPLPGGAQTPVLDPSLTRELERIREQTSAITMGICALAIGLAVILALSERRMALLPIAFVLGWLNLVGL